MTWTSKGEATNRAEEIAPFISEDHSSNISGPIAIYRAQADVFGGRFIHLRSSYSSQAGVNIGYPQAEAGP
jgi:hypothetical protein